MPVCTPGSAGPALVQTVDFFTPIVDDPYVYGEIAAANALSDVYAMGGRPLTALAIAGFPEDLVDAATIAAVFKGGHDTLRKAGVVSARRPHRARSRDQVRLCRDRCGLAAIASGAMPARVPATCSSSPSRSARASSARPSSSSARRPMWPHAPSPACARSIALRPRRWRDSTSTRAPTSPGLVCSATPARWPRPAGCRSSSMPSPCRSWRGCWSWSARIGPAGSTATAATSAAGSSFVPACRPTLADLLYDPQTSGGLLLALSAEQVAAATERADSALEPWRPGSAWSSASKGVATYD